MAASRLGALGPFSHGDAKIALKQPYLRDFEKPARF